MHIVRSARPRQELREFVRAYGQREVTDAGADIVQPVTASLEQILDFEFCRPPLIDYHGGESKSAYSISVIGPHTYPPAFVRLHGRVESFAIFFQPFGFWQLFRVPGRLFIDKDYAGGDVLGKEIHTLWLRMGESASFEERVRMVEAYLLKRAACVSGCTSIMKTARFLFQHGGTSRIGELANHAALGVRQYERRFRDEIGVAPKLFARITRFQMALDAKLTAPQRSWLGIAHQFGYFDQMHMIRDFQSFSGGTPGSTLLHIGDIRPPALAAAKACGEAMKRDGVKTQILSLGYESPGCGMTNRRKLPSR